MPRDKMPCSYYSITASAAVITSSSGLLMQCSVSLAFIRQQLLDIYYSRLLLRQVIALQPRRDDVLLLSRQFSERLAGNLSQMKYLAILLRTPFLSLVLTAEPSLSAAACAECVPAM
jgi:hypothetical protein